MAKARKVIEDRQALEAELWALLEAYNSAQSKYLAELIRICEHRNQSLESERLNRKLSGFGLGFGVYLDKWVAAQRNKICQLKDKAFYARIKKMKDFIQFFEKEEPTLQREEHTLWLKNQELYRERMKKKKFPGKIGAKAA
jgi:hypothetical protein